MRWPRNCSPRTTHTPRFPIGWVVWPGPSIRAYDAAFPDLTFTVNDLIADADCVAVRLTISGTDAGGFRGKPPTGRTINAWGVEFLRIRDGRIVEDWIGADWLGTLEQLGVIDSPWTWQLRQ